ncbi:MAG: LPS export ABC transporter periplasmic protein LptC [Bacteroidetes bacterium]|uniref:LPS export ABC transporter periplasmic protein LptC n=1 Tax=Candidatus Cryptobacteroides excrementipullorum TaxID=2840761 RepID=A0A9D9ITG1_9BACT|nr:LPS export ABC transporter periplasmic protein LptC [Candidatus Cryptobacteroides excrementipullorum]
MIATASAVAFVVYSCKSKIQQADDIDLSAYPVQVVNDMFVVQSENGLLQMRMEADLMERYQNDSVSYEIFPEGFAVYGYNEEGLLETEITSDNARHEKFDKNDVETWAAFGNVVVKNVINKERMETDTLYWDRKNEKIYTDCYVKMFSPKGFMQGYGMESDQRARNSIIFNPFDSYGFVVQDSTEVSVDSVNFIGPFPKK